MKHGGNEPLANAVPLPIEPLTFEQLNDAELRREWRRKCVADIVANPALADGYESAGFGGLAREAKNMIEQIEQQQTDNGWADAHLLALRQQMHTAGLMCETVAEGVHFLLALFEAQGVEGWQKSRFAADAGAN